MTEDQEREFIRGFVHGWMYSNPKRRNPTYPDEALARLREPAWVTVARNQRT